MTLEPIPTVRSAQWASRIAIFSVGLLLVTIALHRFAAMPTPLALNLFVVGLAGAGLALLVGLVAAAHIWITGHAGAGSATVGILLALTVLGGPLSHAAIHHNRPWINDVTTNTANPPAFVTLAQRPPGANRAAYPGRGFAEL